MSDWAKKQKERQRQIKQAGLGSKSHKWLYLLVLIIGLGLPLVGLGAYFYQNYEPKTELEVAGNIIIVRKGGDFQAALNRAKAGDTIQLEAGSTFKGSFVLPKKDGNQFITIQSSEVAKLPKENVRINPKDAPLMPKVVTFGKNEPVLKTVAGSHHFRFIGVEFSVSTPQDEAWKLITIGDDEQKSLEQVPNNIVFDRCYIHAHLQQTGRVRSGISINGSKIEILNSYLSGFRLPDDEGHAIVAWNAPGPFRIINNYIEAAGINVLFGGAWAYKGMNPADLEFRYNYLSKHLEWRGKQKVKNLFELKDMRRAIIEENVMENNWASGQDGTAILFTPASFQSGPDARVEDVVFRSNIVRRTANAITMTGTDYGDKNYPNIPVQNSRVKFENNLFSEVSRKFGDGSSGKFLLLTSGAGPDDLVFNHNTIENEGTLIYFDSGPHNNFTFTNNTANHNEYGVFASGKLGSGIGTLGLQKYAKKYLFKKNVIVGANASQYPTDNFYVSTLGNINNYKGKGTDGKDLGADILMLKEMEKKVMAGIR